MNALSRLTVISLSVATVLGLTACGGGSDGSVFNGQENRQNMFGPAVNTSAGGTSATPIPNQDSDQYTSATPITDWQNPSESEPVAKIYYTSKTRDSLHGELKAAYGDRFETTFRYTTKLSKDGADVTTTYRNNDGINLDALAKGHQVYTMHETEETHIDGVKYTGDRTSRIQLYQQGNSVVLGRQTLSGTLSNGSSPVNLTPTELRIDQIKGTPYKRPSIEDINAAITSTTDAATATATARSAVSEAQTALAAAIDATSRATAQTALNAANSALNTAILAETAAKNTRDSLIKQNDIFVRGLEFSYKGEAFNKDSTNTANKGTLDYHINFNTRTGHGRIEGLTTGTIHLNNADLVTVTHQNPDEGISVGGKEIVSNLSMIGVRGVADFADNRADGTYTLGIFGELATEVAGVVTENNVNTVGFGGVKVSER